MILHTLHLKPTFGTILKPQQTLLVVLRWGFVISIASSPNQKNRWDALLPHPPMAVSLVSSPTMVSSTLVFKVINLLG